MNKKLVIVESPAKAHTISRFLGNRFIVMASIGHIRDLPKSKLGIDIENDFQPQYSIPRDKTKVVQELKNATKEASSLYLATDHDREGEAISWHLVQAINVNNIPVHRVVFEEITKEAIDTAFHHPRDIDMQLVQAQQARRILDRLVGYKLSPILWKKIRRGLSAGRVQSAVLKMIVDRDREINEFTPVEYWSIDAELYKDDNQNNKGKPISFKASFIGVLGTHKQNRKLTIHKKQDADRIISHLENSLYSVNDIRKKDTQRQPSPPFTTSTLQQEAWRKLKYSSKRTMALAQQLYEGLPIGEEGTIGLITYMRTDSTRVAASAIADVRSYIIDKYGADFVPKNPRTFTKKTKGAQEAHEAIRPTSIRREPDKMKPFLTRDQLKLYELIWKRLVSSQMANALMHTVQVEIAAKSKEVDITYLLRSSNTMIKFPGFISLYSEGKDDNGEISVENPPLPELTKGQILKLLRVSTDQHFTQPPPLYTEASLIKALEENGIGRPSTYAPILSIIQSRGYVVKKSGSFYPEQIGILVCDLLSEHFSEIIDLGFTALIENELDEIARGQKELVPVIRGFYEPFEKDIIKAAENIPKIKLADTPTDEICELCGNPLVIKQGRYGSFIACSAFPTCKYTRSILKTIGVKCPLCSGELVERKSKKGSKFYGCVNYPNCNFTSKKKPKQPVGG